MTTDNMAKCPVCSGIGYISYVDCHTDENGNNYYFEHSYECDMCDGNKIISIDSVEYQRYLLDLL